MKKAFERPFVTIDRFEVDDILTTSNTQGTEIWEGYDGPSNPGDGGTSFDPDWDW